MPRPLIPSASKHRPRPIRAPLHPPSCRYVPSRSGVAFASAWLVICIGMPMYVYRQASLYASSCFGMCLVMARLIRRSTDGYAEPGLDTCRSMPMHMEMPVDAHTYACRCICLGMPRCLHRNDSAHSDAWGVRGGRMGRGRCFDVDSIRCPGLATRTLWKTTPSGYYSTKSAYAKF